MNLNYLDLMIGIFELRIVQLNVLIPEFTVIDSQGLSQDFKIACVEQNLCPSRFSYSATSNLYANYV